MVAILVSTTLKCLSGGSLSLTRDLLILERPNVKYAAIECLRLCSKLLLSQGTDIEFQSIPHYIIGSDQFVLRIFSTKMKKGIKWPLKKKGKKSKNLKKLYSRICIK